MEAGGSVAGIVQMELDQPEAFVVLFPPGRPRNFLLITHKFEVHRLPANAMDRFAIQPPLRRSRTRPGRKTGEFIGRTYFYAWLGVDQDAVPLHQETVIELLIFGEPQVVQELNVRAVMLLRVGDVYIVVCTGDSAEAGIYRPAAFQP